MRLQGKFLCLSITVGIALLSWTAIVSAGCSDEEYLKAEGIYQRALKEQLPETKIQLLEQAFQACPSHGNFSTGYYALGKLYYERQEPDKAFKWLSQANRFRSAVLFDSVNNLAQTNLLLGKLYRDKGDAEKALIHLNIYKALTKTRNKSVDQDFIENAESLFSVVYSPSSVKAFLDFDSGIAPEYRAKLNRLEVYFDFAKATLTDEAKSRLEGIGQALQADGFKDCSIVVEGHTDEVGRERSNCRLGKRRAMAVIDYLKTTGNLDHVNLFAKSFGEFAPTIPREGRDRSQWPQIDRFNRRVVIWNAGRNDASFKDIKVEGLASQTPCSE